MSIRVLHFVTAFVVLTDSAAKRASSNPQASLSTKRAIAKHVSDEKVGSFTFAPMIMIHNDDDSFFQDSL
jgi:hypothetical protein